MTTYWSILEKVKGSALRLTRCDDEILEHLKEAFPEFDPAETIDEDKMKSKAGKERWRNFMMKYEKKVPEFNFGTMLRTNPKFEYGRDETIFGRSKWRAQLWKGYLAASRETQMLTLTVISPPCTVLRHRDCEVRLPVCRSGASNINITCAGTAWDLTTGFTKRRRARRRKTR